MRPMTACPRYHPPRASFQPRFALRRAPRRRSARAEPPSPRALEKRTKASSGTSPQLPVAAHGTGRAGRLDVRRYTPTVVSSCAKPSPRSSGWRRQSSYGGRGDRRGLGLPVRLLVAQGDAVVTSDGGLPTFNYHVTGFGGSAAQGALRRAITRTCGPLVSKAEREVKRQADLSRRSRQPDGQLA